MGTSTPDYEGLLKLFPRLTRFPDATGETTLTSAEAAEIRALGFQAEAGEWNIPFIPFQFVRDTPFDWASQLPHTGSHDAQDRDLRGTATQSRAIVRDDVTQSQQASGQEGPSRLGQRMIRAAKRAGGRIPKRRLQQKLWRTTAKEFNDGLSELIHTGSLKVEGKIILLASQHLRS